MHSAMREWIRTQLEEPHPTMELAGQSLSNDGLEAILIVLSVRGNIEIRNCGGVSMLELGAYLNAIKA